MDNAYADNLTYGASELAKRSSVSVSLSGWPAAFAIMSIPLSVVAIYALKELNSHTNLNQWSKLKQYMEQEMMLLRMLHYFSMSPYSVYSV